MDTHLTPATLHNEPGTTHEILAAILEQGRQTLELVKALVGLLAPKGEQEGPTLEELLAKIMAQQSQLITIGKMTQADLDRIGKALPEAVVDAIEERRALPS
jgi:DNA repair protein RadC